jgi:hypothetical protein
MNISRFKTEGYEEFKKTFPEIDYVSIDISAEGSPTRLAVRAVDGRIAVMRFKRNE